MLCPRGDLSCFTYMGCVFVWSAHIGGVPGLLQSLNVCIWMCGLLPRVHRCALLKAASDSGTMCTHIREVVAATTCDVGDWQWKALCEPASGMGFHSSACGGTRARGGHGIEPWVEQTPELQLCLLPPQEPLCSCPAEADSDQRQVCSPSQLMALRTVDVLHQQ